MDGMDTQTEVHIKSMVADWVQQRAMRFIDFIMYQVLEIFYPSLISFSKYYSKENVIRFALSVMNDPNFVRQKILIDSLEFNLCSTTNMDHKLCISIDQTVITNDRLIIPKIIGDPTYMPFKDGLESDVWTVQANNARLDIVDESAADEMADALERQTR